MNLGEKEANIHSNLLFVLADIIETCLMDTNQLLAKDGFEFRHEAKRNFNSIISSIKKLKRNIDHCSGETQDSFGKDSDMLYQTIKLLLDRCGVHDLTLLQIYQYIESFPSQLKMKELDNTVFNHINHG